MSLIKFNNDLFPKFDSFFNDVWGGKILTGFQTGTTVPAVNVIEKEGAYHIEVAAPGLTKEDFKINLDNNTLLISSEKKEEKEEKEGGKVTLKEFSFSKFQRSFQLPELVDKEGVKATYKDGVLTIELPMKKVAIPESSKQIEIS